MRNKQFFHDLRLTVPEHHRSRRRSHYARSERKGLSLWTHATLILLAILVFAGV